MHVNVAIVGLDRLSASFGLALKRYQNQPRAEHSFTIIGSDTHTQAMKAAEKMGAVDNFDRKLLKATDNADLILINAPASKLEETYTRLGPELKSGAVVLELGSLKQPAVERAQQHFTKNAEGIPIAYLVGVTPIVSVHGLYNDAFGPEAASADLFDNAEFLITPDPKCPAEAIALAEDIIKLVGGKPRFMDPVEHDGLIAATEGLPDMLSAALFYTLQQSEGWMELRRMINPTLALATQNLRYQTPADLSILMLHNRENLVRHLESLIGVLDELHDALEDNDTDKLEAFLSVVAQQWEKWDVKRHSGKWDDTQEVETLPGPFGSVGGFLTMRRTKSADDD